MSARVMRRLAGLVCLGVLLTSGCASDNQLVVATQCSYAFDIVSGNAQAGARGTELAARLTVSPHPDPVDQWFCTTLGAQVEWSIESGGGTVAVASDNPWQARWTLGPGTGTQLVRATWKNPPAGRISATTLLFSAEAR